MRLFEEPNITICYNCDSEFIVDAVSVDESLEVCFCPYCGVDMNEEDPLDDDEESVYE
jgi:hypothetical protein